jgi:hypothetical protein
MELPQKSDFSKKIRFLVFYQVFKNGLGFEVIEVTSPQKSDFSKKIRFLVSYEVSKNKGRTEVRPLFLVNIS